MPVEIDSGSDRPDGSTTRQSVPPTAVGSHTSSSGNNISGSSNNNNNNGGVVNMNAASGGAVPPVRPTTTSRRGGRSRSPVAALPGHRPQSSLSQAQSAPPPSQAQQQLPPHTNNNNSNSGPGGAPPGGEGGDNPSSAAAAAAAAAKAYSTGRGGPAPWQQQQQQQTASLDVGPPPPPDSDSGGYAKQHAPHLRPPPPASYDRDKLPPPSSYPPPSNWPGEDPSAVVYRQRGGGGGGGYSGVYDPRHAPPPSPFTRPGDDYGDRRYHPREPSPRYDDPHHPHHHRYGPPPPRGMPPAGPSPYPPPPEYHHRYGGPPPPPPAHHHHHGAQQQQHHPRGPPPPPHHRPPPEYYPHSRRSGGGGPSSSSSSSYHHRESLQQQHRGRDHPSAMRVGGTTTTLVIGGATPIHLPKSPVAVSTSASSLSLSSNKQHPKHRGGSAASVFRGRPEPPPQRSSPNPEDDNSPQKILLSLRTPTTSFEEIKDKSAKNKLQLSNNNKVDMLSPSPLQNNSHQQRSPEGLLFEPQRSDGSKAGGSMIDTAPSFNLFDRSFDSFGDANYFNVDSTLQADDSFGLGQTESVGNDVATPEVLRKNSSTFSTQFLAHSGSGALTIGYSPVNSFGNASAAASRRGSNNMMVVGGHDARSSSPTQVLGMYRSYSGGTVRPLDDSHMRMSVGSFGGQSMSGYNRSYVDPAASPSSYYMGPIRSHESVDRLPPFYALLRKFRAAFRDCSFLLPGVKSALLEHAMSDRNDGDASDLHGEDPSVKSMGGHPYQGGSGMYGEPASHDIAIARRRVESSVCAFGGNLQRGRVATQAQSNREAIFREKDGAGDKMSAAVTPLSSDASGGVNAQSGRKRTKYEEDLPSRYYESESRLSWEFEENPPVEVPLVDETEIDATESGQTSVKTEQDITKDDKGNSEDDQYCLSVNGDGDGASTEKGSASPQAKMRYRCKLCGQPKQNHRCPYQQALARSIGTMVYPAVNAFTADEPGMIAAPLSEMNNFVDVQKDGSETSPTRPTPDRMRRISTVSGGPMIPLAQVTPETMRPHPRQPRSSSNRHINKKRMYSQMKGGSTDQGDLLFVEAMELKPEQFRIVSQPKSRKSADAYVYPALPLPYAQRKRLSDNLFSLSNEVPKLTDECAHVLREAREKDMWDLAVAELMTQVIVIIHCSDRDYRFEGLRQYLLTLGISC